LPFFERLFIVVLLLSGMGIVDALLRPSPAGGHDLDVISTDVPLATAIPESAVYVCGTFIVLMYWRRVLRAARAAYPLVCLTALAPLSIAWSHAPLLTLRRSVLLLGSTFLGIYLGERFTIEQLARLLTQAMCLMMVAVITLYLVAPAHVIDYTGAWKGLSGWKNPFGGYMAIAVLLLLLYRFRHLCRLRYAFLAAAAVLLLLSRSATSLLDCILMIMAMPLWRLADLSGKRRWLAYTVLPAAVFSGFCFAWLNRDLLFQILGRDSTLTGRTQLWSLVLPAILKHPLLGYGYGGFWTGLNSDTLNVYIGSKWLPVEAHNGYLDLCLAFGILALPIFTYVFVQSLRMAYDFLKADTRPIGLWPITYLIFFGLHNLFESHLLTTRSLEFLLFAAITTSLALHRRSYKLIALRQASDVHTAFEMAGIPCAYG
jgi:O-antigen ligase